MRSILYSPIGVCFRYECPNIQLFFWTMIVPCCNKAIEFMGKRLNNMQHEIREKRNRCFRSITATNIQFANCLQVNLIILALNMNKSIQTKEKLNCMRFSEQKKTINMKSIIMKMSRKSIKIECCSTRFCSFFYPFLMNANRILGNRREIAVNRVHRLVSIEKWERRESWSVAQSLKILIHSLLLTRSP